MANAAMLRLARDEVADESTPEMLHKQWASGVAAQFEGLGGRVTDALGITDEAADTANRVDQARQAAAYETYPEGFGGRVGKAAMGAATTTTSMYGSGAVGGLKGMVGAFAAQAGNQAYTEAIDAGLDETSALAYAGRAAAIEAGITSAFSAVGAGGAESIITGVRQGAIKQATKARLKDALLQAGKDVSAELAES